MIDSLPVQAGLPARLGGVSVAAIAAALALTASPARGQTTAPVDAETPATEDIVVTARKRGEALMNTPLAVTALDQSALEEASVASLDEVTNLVPNISITDNAGDTSGVGFSAVYIRGIGQNDSSNGIDPGVGIYIDGLYYGRTIGGVMDLPDIAQIEVLRGPQGTLFGKNTMGGAVSVTSRRPGSETSFSASGTLGTDNRRNLDLSGDLRISDAVGLRVLFAKRLQDGYIPRPVAGDSLGEEDATITRAKLEINPSDSTTILLSGDYSRIKGSGAQVVNRIVNTALGGVWNNLIGRPLGQSINPDAASPDLTVNRGESEHTNDLESWGISSLIETELSGVTVRSITGYRSYDSRVAVDQDGQPIVFSANVYNNGSDQFSQELNLLGTGFDNRLNWLVGAFYFDEVAQTLQNARVASPLIQQDLFSETRTDSFAVFGEATYKLTDRLSLTAGARYTLEDKEFYTEIKCVTGNYITIVPACQAAAAGTPNVFSKAPTRARDSWNSIDPRLILSYQASEDVLVYGSYSTGFKSGGFNTRSTSVELSGISVEPEDLTAYEIGLKATLDDGRLRLRTAAFLYDYNKIQLTFSGTVVTGVNETVLANIGTAQYKGVEAEATWRPVPRLTLGGAVGYLDARYTEIDTAAASEIARLNNFTLNTNFKLPKAPEWTASANISYVTPIGRGDITWRVDYAYQSSSFNDIYNGADVATPAHALVNGRITYTAPNSLFSIAVYGKNLTDRRYVVNGFDTIAAGATQNLVAVSEPREIGVTAKVDF